ncbi:MAG: hypothetical protein R2853_11890 [Thermomicrobiales bacterium]
MDAKAQCKPLDALNRAGWRQLMEARPQLSAPTGHSDKLGDLRNGGLDGPGENGVRRAPQPHRLPVQILKPGNVLC